MLEESGSRVAFICPAFPAMGRTLKDGVLYVGNSTLTQAQEGRDPFSRARTSSVVELFERQTGRPVGLVRLSDVEGGEDSVERRIAALLRKGCDLVVFDAALTEHLDRIGAVLERRCDCGLPVGSAGLASALWPGLVNKRADSAQRHVLQVSAAPFVLASGSLNRVTRAQLERIRRTPGFRLVSVDVRAVLGPHAVRQAEARRVATQLDQALGRGDDVGLCWGDPLPARDAGLSQGSISEDADRLGRFIQLAVKGVANRAAISGLVLVGGDTAYSVLSGLGANGVFLDEEIQPGIPMGAVIGGDIDGRFVVTKAGGFGDEETLARLIAFIDRKRGIHRSQSQGDS